MCFNTSDVMHTTLFVFIFKNEIDMFFNTSDVMHTTLFVFIFTFIRILTTPLQIFHASKFYPYFEHFVFDNFMTNTVKAWHLSPICKDMFRWLGRHSRRWKDNIKLDLQEVGCVGMDWNKLAQDMYIYIYASSFDPINSHSVYVFHIIPKKSSRNNVEHIHRMRINKIKETSIYIYIYIYIVYILVNLTL
jgi:acyl-coenzyme A synthetase/AMP-(fatty) acid ligase